MARHGKSKIVLAERSQRHLLDDMLDNGCWYWDLFDLRFSVLHKGMTVKYGVIGNAITEAMVGGVASINERYSGGSSNLWAAANDGIRKPPITVLKPSTRAFGNHR